MAEIAQRVLGEARTIMRRTVGDDADERLAPHLSTAAFVEFEKICGGGACDKSATRVADKEDLRRFR